jgi:Bacterial pre-peptidase C-terminal domain
MISRVLLRRTLVLPLALAAFVACSDDNGSDPTGGSFTLGAPASTQVSLQPGQATTVTIPVTFTGNMSPVSLRADSVPSGVRVGFAPATITSGTTVVTVSITADPAVTAKTGTVKIVATAPGMTTPQVARIAVTTTAQPSYSITNNTSTAAPVVIKRGQGNTITVTFDRAGGFTGPVDIIADAVPAGFTISQPTNVTGNTATVTITTTNLNTASGTGSFTLRAINPGMIDRTTTVQYSVTPEYTLTNSASTAATAVQIQRTASGTATITINRDTYQGPVTLTASGLPTGITVPTVTDVAGNTATITINTAATAVADTGSFLITGTAAGYQNQTTRVHFRVLAEPGVQIAAANRSVLQSSPDTMYVTVNREGGFTGPVTVTLTDLPAGVTAAPVTSDAGTTVGVPLDIADDAAVGAKVITVSVSGAGIATKTATPTLTVRSNLLASGTGITLASSRARDTYEIYRVNVPTGATQLRVTLTGGTGDADVEVYNSTFSTRLGSSGAAGNAETITVNNPPAGTVYIVVYVWDAYANATLTATVTGGEPGLASAALRGAVAAPRNLQRVPRQ